MARSPVKTATVATATPPRAKKQKPPPVDAKLQELKDQAEDLGVARKALDDAVSMTRGLWISFISLSAYLMVAVGSVTHVDLFLENPLQLPLVGVKVPLVVFFWLAPIFYLIMHLYLLLNLKLLSDNVQGWMARMEAILAKETASTERKRIAEGHKLALPNFFPVQMLAAPEFNRHGFMGLALSGSVIITLVVWPILLILLFQFQFLPYHYSFVTWLHRVTLLIDIMVTNYFWRKINFRKNTRIRNGYLMTNLFFSFSIIFSVVLIRFPGENALADLNMPKLVNIPDSLILTDIDFVDDEKLSKSLKAAQEQKTSADELDSFVNVRERNFVNAVFDRSDIRYFDFTSSDLTGASFKNSRIAGFRNRCISTKLIRGKKILAEIPAGNCLTRFKGVNLEEVNLAGSDLSFYDLSGTNLTGANLGSANLLRVNLDGAVLNKANLQGANLSGAKLRGARLDRSQLQGAILKESSLKGISLQNTRLQGADLSYADLSGAIIFGADLQGTDLRFATFEGATIINSNFRYSLINRQTQWRLAVFDSNEGQDDRPATPAEFKKSVDDASFQIPEGKVRDMVVKTYQRGQNPESLIDRPVWSKILASGLRTPTSGSDPVWLEFAWKDRAVQQRNLACSNEAPPHLANSLIIAAADKNQPGRKVPTFFGCPYRRSLARYLLDNIKCEGARNVDVFQRALLDEWAGQIIECELPLPDDQPETSINIGKNCFVDEPPESLAKIPSPKTAPQSAPNH